MSKTSLDSRSVEYALEVISAINDLSVEAKLRLEGRAVDQAREKRAAEARRTLGDFLTRLGPIVEEAARSEEAVVTGDPQLARLARDVVAERHQIPRTQLGAMDLSELGKLVGSQRSGDGERLVEGLRALRRLLSQHIQPGLAELMRDV